MGLWCSYQSAVAAVLAAAMGLAGCRPTLVEEAAGGPWTPIPPGSTLTLNRPVSVPQDRARVFFGGAQVSQVGANMGPSCGLEVGVMSRARPQRIAAQSCTGGHSDPEGRQGGYGRARLVRAEEKSAAVIPDLGCCSNAVFHCATATRPRRLALYIAASASLRT